MKIEMRPNKEQHYSIYEIPIGSAFSPVTNSSIIYLRTTTGAVCLQTGNDYKHHQMNQESIYVTLPNAVVVVPNET